MVGAVSKGQFNVLPYIFPLLPGEGKNEVHAHSLERHLSECFFKFLWVRRRAPQGFGELWQEALNTNADACYARFFQLG